MRRLLVGCARDRLTWADSDGTTDGDDRNYGEKTNPEVAKAYRAKVESGLDGYDAMLAKTRFLAGDVS